VDLRSIGTRIEIVAFIELILFIGNFGCCLVNFLSLYKNADEAFQTSSNRRNVKIFCFQVPANRF